MADDKNKDAAGRVPPEPREQKFKADPFAKLTDQDWIEAMERGLRQSEARDREIGRGIRGGYESSIRKAVERVAQAESALKTYLERPDRETEDLPRHRKLAEDLKKAVDDLKNNTDEYVVLISNRPGAQ
jgi:hypothetical protein